MQGKKELLLYIFLMQLLVMFKENIYVSPQPMQTDDSDLIQIERQGDVLTVQLDASKLEAPCQDPKLTSLFENKKTPSRTDAKQQTSVEILDRFFQHQTTESVSTHQVSFFFSDAHVHQVVDLAHIVGAKKVSQEVSENIQRIVKITKEITTEVKTSITMEEEIKITKIKGPLGPSVLPKKKVEFQVNRLVPEQSRDEIKRLLKEAPTPSTKKKTETLLEVVDAFNALTATYIQEEVKNTYKTQCNSGLNFKVKPTLSASKSTVSSSKLSDFTKPTVAYPPIISEKMKDVKTGTYSFTIDISTTKDSKGLSCPYFIDLPHSLESHTKHYLKTLEQSTPFLKDRYFETGSTSLHSRVSFFFTADYFYYLRQMLSFLNANVQKEIQKWQTSAAQSFTKILGEIERYIELSEEKKFEETITENLVHHGMHLVRRDEEKILFSYRPVLNLAFLENAKHEIKSLTEPQKQTLDHVKEHVELVDNVVESYIQFYFIQNWYEYCETQQPGYIHQNLEALKTIQFTVPMTDNGKRIDCKHPMLHKNFETMKEKSQGAAWQLSMQAKTLGHEIFILINEMHNNFNSYYDMAFDETMLLQFMDLAFEKTKLQTRTASSASKGFNRNELKKETRQAFEAHLQTTKKEITKIRKYLTKLFSASKKGTLDEREVFRVEGCDTRTKVDSNGKEVLDIVVDYKPVYATSAFTETISKELEQFHANYLIWYDFLLRGAIEYEFYKRVMSLCEL